MDHAKGVLVRMNNATGEKQYAAMMAGPKKIQIAKFGTEQIETEIPNLLLSCRLAAKAVMKRPAAAPKKKNAFG